MQMLKKISLLLFCWIAVSQTLFAQDFSNLRFKKITITNDTISIDTMSMVPGSTQLVLNSGALIDTSKFKIEYAEAKIIFKNDDFFTQNIFQKEVYIRYRVFPVLFSKPLLHKPLSLNNSAKQIAENPFLFSYETKTEDVFKWGTLSKNGNISRGISFGNNQDVVVNSGLNLQLSGYLSDEIQVLAAITDNNIPIQPDGNTQQLQEFDKVFIQLFNKKNKLIAGDFEIGKPRSYFMNFYKKAQGALIESNIDFKSKKGKDYETHLYLQGCGAVTKGKYARNLITAIEGNQGPYKLSGNNFESFIIVLAGTEKVYIDGKLLTRGESNDYIIDYNLGEITFMASQLITKDKRILVEFEYTDRNYARTLFFAGTELDYRKLKVRFNYFSESDLKNQSLQQDLSETEKLLLQSVGDSTQLAFVPNVDSITFSANYVMYKMIDTTVNSILYDSVFVYSTNADSAFYRLGFSYVGSGNGNYILTKSSANGRVFQWVAPIGNQPQGEYEPVKLLIAPQKKQMYTLGVDYAIGKTTMISVEGALTNYNRNAFSDLNKSDDYGYAIKSGITNNFNLNKKSGWTLSADIYNEYVDKNFKPVEPYRSVEFSRDWNLSGVKNSAEILSEVHLGIQNKKNQKTDYRLRYLDKGSFYNGMQQLFSTSNHFKNFYLNVNASYLKSSMQTLSTVYFKHDASLIKKFKWFSIGVSEQQENNKFSLKSSDSLSGSSFGFNVYEAFIKSPDSASNKYSLSYKKRLDQLPVNDRLKRVSDADDINFSLELRKNYQQVLKALVTYRMLKILDTLSVKTPADNMMIGRLEYISQFWKRLVQSNLYYEVGSGMEEKKEFTYVEVPAGQGVYAWKDYNNDGVQQLNEFENSIFQDQANYIRVFTPSHDYMKTYSNKFGEALIIEPSNLWAKKKGFLKVLSRFSLNVSYNIENKSSNKNLLQAYNPFYASLNDTSLLTTNTQFRSVLFINKNASKTGGEFSYSKTNSKMFLVNGYETRIQQTISTKWRWNIVKSVMFNLMGLYGAKNYFSDYLNTKNYDIAWWETEPKISFQPGKKFRISLIYNYSNKQNFYGINNEKAIINDFGLDLKYNFPGKGTLTARCNYINIQYNQDENTSLSYEMLEGLQKGQNITWNLAFQHNLGNNMQLDLVYDGRKAGSNKIVHVGSMQIRAYF
jgi:hypothetical protein